MITKIADFLGTTFINNKYFYFDYWMIIHFFFGFILMFLLIKYLKNKSWVKFWVLFFALSSWEVFEGIATWIRPETFTDIFYDMVFGMLGGIIYWKLNKKKND